MDRKIKSKVTYSFLLYISHHLSCHSNCRNIEYEVHIDDGKISIEPDIMIFNDTYHRKHHDYTSVKDHIFLNHLTDVKSSDLVDGIYKYKFNVNRTQRRWIRTK